VLRIMRYLLAALVSILFLGLDVQAQQGTIVMRPGGGGFGDLGALLRRALAERGGRGNDQAHPQQTQSNGPGQLGDIPTELDQDDAKPVVYRAGNLPKELPAWFAQLDRDHDGQVGLYEWKDSGRSLEEFRAIDRNDDGFLTVEEVLAYTAKQKKNGAPGSWAGPGFSTIAVQRQRPDRGPNLP